MSKARPERIPTPALLSYLDDELSADEAAAIDRVRVESESVRRRLSALGALRRALQAPVPSLEGRKVSLDLDAALRARRETSARLGTPTRRRTPGALLVLSAAAALLLGVGLGQLQPLADDSPSARDIPLAEVGMRAKSAKPEASAARWAGIRAFRLAAAGSSPERLKRSLQQEDGLLFAYTNLGSEPFEHLMIFGVDAAMDVRWFYPPHTSARQNPTSISIQAGREVALSEVVWLDLPKGPFIIYAVFTREPLDVWAVESWLKAHPAGGAGFAAPGAVVSQLAVTVE